MSKTTPASVIEAAIKISNISKSDVIVDLGSGDGRVCQLASLMSGCSSVGIEIDINEYTKAIKHTEKLGIKNVSFINNDFMKEDLTRYNVVFIYQSGRILKKLSKKLRKECNCTRIVTHRYPLYKCTPSKSIEIDGHKLFFYNMGVA